MSKKEKKVKKSKNVLITGASLSNGRIKTPMFRVSYPSVFKPTDFQGNGQLQYSVTMLFDKKRDLSIMRDAVDRLIEEKFKDVKRKKIRLPFRDGNEEKEDIDGYKDCIFVRAASKTKPIIVDCTEERNQIEDETEFYPGCYARATIIPFAYDQKGNKGISFGLHNLQFLKDGEPFTNRGNPDEDYDDDVTNDDD
jgi:hypothetical protein